MGPGKYYDNVGKSQSVLMMINPMISPRTSSAGSGRSIMWRQQTEADHVDRSLDRHAVHLVPIPARPFPSSIFLDKNRRDIGKSQSIWTDSKMETSGSPIAGHLREAWDRGVQRLDVCKVSSSARGGTRLARREIDSEYQYLVGGEKKLICNPDHEPPQRVPILTARRREI
jgi:hypothetical protein